MYRGVKGKVICLEEFLIFVEWRGGGGGGNCAKGLWGRGGFETFLTHRRRFFSCLKYRLYQSILPRSEDVAKALALNLQYRWRPFHLSTDPSLLKIPDGNWQASGKGAFS